MDCGNARVCGNQNVNIVEGIMINAMVFRTAQPNDMVGRTISTWLKRDVSFAGMYITAYLGEKIVATIGIQCVTHYVHEVKHLYIVREYRGQGIGTKLLKDIRSVMLAPMYIATVRTENIAARNLFAKCGWAIEGIKDSPYSQNRLCAMRIGGIIDVEA